MRRQSHRRSFRPQPDILESRIALSGDLGIGIYENASWTNAPVWTNLRNLATSWLPASGSSLALSLDGYPLANASVKFATINYPNGTYGFSYTGAGTVTFGDVGQLAGPVTVSGGVTSGTITVNHNTGDGDFLTMQLTGVNAANPMDNLAIMAPGYGNGTTPEPMFMPALTQALAPFSDIRFMGLEIINNSTLANWANRVEPNSFNTDGPEGIPYEDMIELCNEAQKDMWINIPVMATPQFVQSLAQLIDSELDSNLNVYVEYGNENWNASFQQYSQVLAAGKANSLVAQSSNNLQTVAQQSAYEEISDAQIFEQTFGAASSRIRPIVAGFEAGSSYQQMELQFIQQTYGPPSQFIYATAVAPYVQLPSGTNVGSLTLSQVFADLNQNLTSQNVPALQADAAVAKQFDVPLVAYEGGQSLVPGSNDAGYSVMLQAQNDPRMNQLYTALLTDWQNAGGSLFDITTIDGPPSQSGFWGILPTLTGGGSQEYNALIAQLEPQGDANFDGTVDYSDFQTLQANFGATGAYWQQGDFNDDGVVNAQDLNILRQSLNPTTFSLGQFAQQALAGEPSATFQGQTQQYAGYGVTYLTSAMISSSSNGSGPVMINTTSTGQGIVISGLSYNQGLGVVANSSIVVPLNGAYSSFESTIGIDGYSNTGSSVIFSVSGDGRLLYQSPVVSFSVSNGGIPIEVNVNGVQQLTLTVTAAPGSTSSQDHAVWGAARLASTANFGTMTPYALNWQVSNSQGKILSNVTGDSYIFGEYPDGNYTLSLTVTDGSGNSAVQSEQVAVGLHGPYWVYALPGSQKVELDWQPEGASASSYDIYRSTSPNPNTMVLYKTGLTLPKFVDTGVTNGTTYYYLVAAVDANGIVGPGSAASAMPVVTASANTDVSAMTFSATSGTVVRGRSALPDSFGDGATMPLALWGVPYTSGLGFKGNSSAQIALNGSYTTFTALLGLDTQAPAGGGVVYKVVADGKTLYTSPTVTLSTGWLTININVAGYNMLSLTTTVVSGSGDAVDANWANPLLTQANITLATSLPNANTNGIPSATNKNVQGGPLVIGGTQYAQGVGMAAGASLAITTNGAYSTFTATIGMDSLAGTGSPVNFWILGDGQTLYWSPVFTTTTAPVSISINIKGAKTLTLMLVTASGTVDTQSNADFALAEIK